ncbi:MAG: type II toxin-antitoxin system RelB/DinJ family antitoxin [Oscillospiraceae bacterium]|nr:type II toxin-antitoxin system RelB/DinJ family antitoxin [Oscillospiraceae bacterium]
MSKATSLNIKIDRDLKTQADNLFNRMGMSFTTAVNVFVRQAVQEQAIPFRIYVNDSENEALEKARQALKDIQAQSIVNGTSEMTMDEIDAEIAAYRREKRGLNAESNN